MRYVTDILQRYQGGWSFVEGALAANLEGFINRGIFAAGLAYNEKQYKRQNNDVDYKLEMYPSDKWNFADIKLIYEDRKLEFGLSSLVNPAENSFVAPPPIVRFKRSKYTEETVIDNADEAEIIEYMSTSSWEIEMRGVIVDMENHQYPQAKLQEFAKFFEINDIMEVHSTLFLDLGITSIWFKEQEIEPLEAFPDTVKYSLTAKSIKPAEFSILNGI